MDYSIFLSYLGIVILKSNIRGITMVLSIGEILVDIFMEGDKKTVFPGGAPFNVAANIAHFNGDVSFYGVVGNDEYGHFLLDFAKKKIPSALIEVKDDRDTTEAIVSLDNGERSFRFKRDNGSDYLLDINSLKQFDLSKVSIVHLGSLMLSYKEGRDFFDEAVKYIRDNTHCLISFDVNYRDDIFNSEKEAKEIFINAIKCADIIKFTEEELELLTKQKDVLNGLKSLLNDNQIAVVTLGKDGSIFYYKDKFIKVASYPLKPVDTTGAGDAFYSYFLYRLDLGIDLTDDSQIINVLKRANITGGLATQKKGAIDIAPSNEEIENFLKSRE